MNIVRQLHGLLQKDESEIRVILKYLKDGTVAGMIAGNGMKLPFTIDGPIDMVDEIIVDRYRVFLENRKVTVTDNAEVTKEEKEEAKKPTVTSSSSTKKKTTATAKPPAKPEAPKIDPVKEAAIKKAGASPFIKLFTDVETQYVIAQMEAKDRAIVDKMINNLQTHRAKPNHDKDMATYIIDSIYREIVAKLKDQKLADQTKAILNAQETKPKAEEPKPASTAQTTAFPITSEEEAPFDDGDEEEATEEGEEADEANEEESDENAEAEDEDEEDVPAADVLEAETPSEVFEQPAPPPPAPKPAPKATKTAAPKPAPAPQPAAAPKVAAPKAGAVPNIAPDLLF